MLVIDYPPAYNAPFNFNARGYSPGETVNIFWSYHQPGQTLVGSAIADSMGTIFYGVKAAPGAPGPHDVYIAAVGTKSGMIDMSYVYEAPEVLVNPGIASPGTQVQVTGGCFGGNEPVTVYLQDSSGTAPVAKAITNQLGSFATNFTVPGFSGSGNATVEVKGNSTGISASTVFGFPPVLTATPTTGPGGTTVTVTGQHFTAYRATDILWSDPAVGGGFPLNRFGIDGSGSFTGTVTIPGGIIKGHTYYLEAEDPITQAWARVAFVAQ